MAESYEEELIMLMLTKLAVAKRNARLYGKQYVYDDFGIEYNKLRKKHKL